MNSITITYIHFYHLIAHQSCLVAAHVPRLLSMVRLLRRSILTHPRTHPLHQVVELRPASSRLRPDRSHLREEPSLIGSILQLPLIAMDHPHPVPLQASAAQGTASTLLCHAQR